MQVNAQTDGTAQGHFVWRVTAHGGVFHVEQGHGAVAAHHAVTLHAALGQVGRHLAAGHGLLDKLRWHSLQKIGLVLQKREPSRLHFFNDGDLYAVNHRQATAFEFRQQSLANGVVNSRLCVVQNFAIKRAAFERNETAAPPLHQAKRPGAHGVRGDFVAVELHHFTRHSAHQVRARHRADEAWRGLVHAELHGVAVQRANALNWPVVVEGRFAVDGQFALLVQAGEFEVLYPGGGRAFDGWVDKSLVGIHVVLGHQLAPHLFAVLALKSVVFSEEDAGFYFGRPGLEVGRHLGHRSSGEWANLGRSRQRVVLVERLKDVRRDGARIVVVDLRRVEPCFGNREGITQHFLACCGVHRSM